MSNYLFNIFFPFFLFFACLVWFGFFSCFDLFCFAFQVKFLGITVFTVFELTLQTRLGTNTQKSACLCLKSLELKVCTITA